VSVAERARSRGDAAAAARARAGDVLRVISLRPGRERRATRRLRAVHGLLWLVRHRGGAGAAHGSAPRLEHSPLLAAGWRATTPARQSMIDERRGGARGPEPEPRLRDKPESEDSEWDRRGSAQQLLQLVIEAHQRERRSCHLERRAILAHVVARHLDAALGELVMRD